MAKFFPKIFRVKNRNYFSIGGSGSILFILFIFVIIALSASIMASKYAKPSFTPKKSFKMLNKKLSAAELSVIENKATEARGGKYDQHFSKGIYQCRRCGQPLYNSTSKFVSSCGWPAFDDEIPQAIKRVPDADGSRTEIICQKCQAHLGHVFTGENLTSNNIRHCVNSISLRFVPTIGETGRAIFAGGCFWGVEFHFAKQAGVLEVTSGYTGGASTNPTYQEICAKDTKHVEAVEVLYDPNIVNFETLATLFFNIHNPEQSNGQGPDIGAQYLSKIFYENESQKETATKLIGLLKSQGLNVATELLPAVAFWPAEDYHQDYYSKKGSKPYCHIFKNKFAND